MDQLPVLAGKLVAVLLFAFPAVFFLDRALRNSPRARRLANLSLVCGLMVFVMPETAFGLFPTGNFLLNVDIGGARFFIGIVGIVLGISALVIRNAGDVGAVRPALGIVFCLLHMFFGMGMAASGFMYQSSTPRQFHSADGQFQVSLPSQYWREVPIERGTAFVCPMPKMQARIFTFEAEGEEKLQDMVASFQSRATPAFLDQAEKREGTTAAGNTFHYWNGMDTDADGKPIWVGYSITWCPRKRIAIEVLVEGMPRRLSETWKAVEIESFEKAGDMICLSAE